MSKRSTKDRILDAAVRLFNESGTAAVSTNHVAEAAGVSPGNLYYHYRNKEEIIREVLKRMIVEWGEVWVLPEDGEPDLGDLRVMMEKNLVLEWKYRFFYREVLALMRRDPELARQHQAIQRERLGEQEMFFEHFIEAGILREPEDPATLPALIKACWLIAGNWLSFLEISGEPTSLEKMREGFDVILQLFRPYLTEEAVRELGNPRHGPAPTEKGSTG